MKRTLGGNRLGSGKKMQVDLDGYGRSTHDLSHVLRTTMSAGTLVPAFTTLCLPGDTIDLDLEADIKTHPTIGPLFGSFKYQLDVFEIPMRLYNAELHMNKLKVGLNIANIKIPQLQLLAPRTSKFDDMQINPSSIMSYLGIAGLGRSTGGTGSMGRQFNAIPYLGYCEIYKNYYANKEEEKGVYIHKDPVTVTQTVTAVTHSEGGVNTTIPQSGNTGVYIPLNQNSSLSVAYTGASPGINNITIQISNVWWRAVDIYQNATDNGSNLIKFDTVKIYWPTRYLQLWNYGSQTQAETPLSLREFPLLAIDEMRTKLFAVAPGTTAVITSAESLEPYGKVLSYNTTTGQSSLMYSQEGLFVKTYQSDMFNNWLNATWVANITTASQVNTASGNFTIDELNIRKKVYDYLNRVAVSGGTYDDWIEVTYSIDKVKTAESPMYHGSLIKELVFDEVVSSSAAGTEDVNQALGQLAGRGVMGKQKKGGKMTIRVNEPSYIMGIMSLTPRIDYYQGNKWDMSLKTFDDFHKPAFDQIGFQDRTTDEMAYYSTDIASNGTMTIKSIGKQPAWIHYMTEVNRTKGNFAIPSNEGFMVLNRTYGWNSTTNQIKDFTSYIDPTLYNYIFAETSLDSQNYWVQVGIGQEIRRVMAAKQMPRL